MTCCSLMNKGIDFFGRLLWCTVGRAVLKKCSPSERAHGVLFLVSLFRNTSGACETFAVEFSYNMKP